MLQEVFAAAFNAMLADEREINVRPWLYRIARNRSLNHLRRAQAVGMDSMDVHLSEGGLTTADKVHKREEFRLLIADVQDLPETQRTALLLREIDALSYDQIAEAMETTVPSVKSLLVRARVSLAEAAEARQLSCDEVRLELGEVAEGLKRTTAPVRRHLRTCDRCRPSASSCAPTTARSPRCTRSGRCCCSRRRCSPTSARTARPRAARPPPPAAAPPPAPPARAPRCRSASARWPRKAAAGLAAAAIVTAGAVEVQHAAHRAARAPAQRGPPRPPRRPRRPSRRRSRSRRRPHPTAQHAAAGDRPAKRASADDEGDAQSATPSAARRRRRCHRPTQPAAPATARRRRAPAPARRPTSRRHAAGPTRSGTAQPTATPTERRATRRRPATAVRCRPAADGAAAAPTDAAREPTPSADVRSTAAPDADPPDAGGRLPPPRRPPSRPPAVRRARRTDA